MQEAILTKLGQLIQRFSEKKSFKEEAGFKSNFREKLKQVNELTAEMVTDQFGFVEKLDEPRPLSNFNIGIEDVNVVASTLGRSGEPIKRIDLDIPNTDQDASLHASVSQNGEFSGVTLSGPFVDGLVFHHLTQDTAQVSSVELFQTAADRFTSSSTVKEVDLKKIKFPGVDFGPRIDSVSYWQTEGYRGGSKIDMVDISLLSWDAVDEFTKGQNCSFHLKKGEDEKFTLYARPIEKDSNTPDTLIESGNVLRDKQGNRLKLSAQNTENGIVRVDIVFEQLPDSSATTYDVLRSCLFLPPVDFESVLDCTRANLIQLKKAL